ncbi:MAG: MAPEG family protein [Psychrosphaera sp.]|nr:MAPEG family protein [Psychrosphaera sp.]
MTQALTQEVLILLAVLVYLFVLTGLQVMLTMKNFGTVTALKGRDNIPYIQPGIGGRLQRAIDNLKESLHFFTPLILLTAIVGASNDNTVLGAQIYLAGRILHAPLYLWSVSILRTGAYVVGLVGMTLIVLGLFGG